MRYEEVLVVLFMVLAAFIFLLGYVIGDGLAYGKFESKELIEPDVTIEIINGVPDTTYTYKVID